MSKRVRFDALRSAVNMHAVSTVVREGEVLAGKYRVERVLGVGGMGIVVAAHHLELDTRVAIKLLLAETLSNPEAVARFAREARAAAKIKSEHVARVSDVGRLENGSPFMVMEYLEGSDLGRWLSERGAIPIEQAVEFVLQASEAIAEAHMLGIVHRDLKPGNLFVMQRPDGTSSIKVLDFGISKFTQLAGSGIDPAMTRASVMMGSPMYMPPEQVRSSKDVDARCDIWALGAVLYELVTGAPPFEADNLPELLDRVAVGSPAGMQTLRPDVSSALERVILRCLEKDRDQRFSSVIELAEALLPFAPARSLTSVERISGTMTGVYRKRASVPTAEPSAAWPSGTGSGASWASTAAVRRHAPRAFVLGTALLLALGLLATRLGAPRPRATAKPELVAALHPAPPALPTPSAAASAFASASATAPDFVSTHSPTARVLPALKPLPKARSAPDPWRENRR